MKHGCNDSSHPTLDSNQHHDSSALYKEIQNQISSNVRDSASRDHLLAISKELENSGVLPRVSLEQGEHHDRGHGHAARDHVTHDHAARDHEKEHGHGHHHTHGHEHGQEHGHNRGHDHHHGHSHAHSCHENVPPVPPRDDRPTPPPVVPPPDDRPTPPTVVPPPDDKPNPPPVVPQPDHTDTFGIGTGDMKGVNLAGAEFGGTWGDKYGTNYIYPTAEELAYYKSKGVTAVRLPFRWERMQPELNAPLDPQELARMDQFLESAKQNGIKVILDAQGFGRYKDQVIGTDVPDSAFADFWKRMADHYKNNSAVWAFDIMNEPHDTGGHWNSAAQAAVDGIRAVDMGHKIMVEGDGWSGAKNWQEINGNLDIHDPANGIIYQAHAYFDADHSGGYNQSYDAQGANPDSGIQDVKPFIDWLKQHHYQGFIGEFGVPNDDPKWLEAQDRFLTYLDQNGIGYTEWAGGPWWNDYKLSVEPRYGQDSPAMDILEKHLNNNS